MRIRTVVAPLGLLALGLLLTACQKLDTVNSGKVVAKLSLPPGPPSELAKVALAVGLVKGMPTAVRPESTSLGACGLSASTISTINTVDLEFSISGPDFGTLTPANSSFTESVGTPSSTEVTDDVVVTDIPAGTGRAITVTLAINSVVTCSGSVTGITISAGATTDVGTIDLKPTGSTSTASCGGSMTFGSRTFTGTTSSVASIGCDPWVFATVSTSPASVTVLAAADYSAAAASYNTLAFVDESTSAGTGTFSFTTGAASGGYGANLTNTSTATVCIFSSGTLTLTAVPAVGGNVTGSFSGGLVGDDPSFCPSTSTSKATSGTFSALREF